MRNRQLPAVLTRDANLMRESLLRDLQKIAGVHVGSTYDDRLLPGAASFIPVRNEKQAWKIWEEQMRQADLIWLIAPESDGILSELLYMAEICEGRVVGCGRDCVERVSDKTLINKLLSDKGIPTAQSLSLREFEYHDDERWVIKPNRGAGSEHCYFVDSQQNFSKVMQSIGDKSEFIVERYVEGESGSISLDCAQDNIQLLGINQQLSRIENHMFQCDAILSNQFSERRRELLDLAESIKQCVPELNGYVGIDLILTEDTVHVVEINPRLTTSYAGLSEQSSFNIAEQILLRQGFIERQGTKSFTQLETA